MVKLLRFGDSNSRKHFFGFSSKVSPEQTVLAGHVVSYDCAARSSFDRFAKGIHRERAIRDEVLARFGSKLAQAEQISDEQVFLKVKACFLFFRKKGSIPFG